MHVILINSVKKIIFSRTSLKNVNVIAYVNQHKLQYK